MTAELHKYTREISNISIVSDGTPSTTKVLCNDIEIKGVTDIELDYSSMPYMTTTKITIYGVKLG